MSLNEVTSHLYIAPVRAVVLEDLLKLNITCVINVSLSNLNIDHPSVRYIQVPLEDTVYENIYTHFDKVTDEIHEESKRGGKTVVCCVAGISRSASFCLAYLMKYENMKLRKAFEYLKTKRGFVHPNSGFFRQLIQLEENIFGETTVQMVTLKTADSAHCSVPDVFQETCKGLVWLKSSKSLLQKLKQDT